MTSDPFKLKSRIRAVRGLEPKLYSITILRTVLYGEIIWGVDNMYYKQSWKKIKGELQHENKLTHERAFTLTYHMKERLKCWRMICISRGTVKLFSSY